MTQPIRASKHLKCLFQPKWPKCPWLALGLTKDQTRYKLPQKNFFRSFTPNPSFSEILSKFDQIWPKVDLGLLGGPKNPNFVLVARTGWNKFHCKDHQILIPTTVRRSKSELEWPRYHKTRDDVPIAAPLTSESHNFWSDRWIFEFYTFLETENEDLSKGVKINPIRGGLRPAAL